MTFMWSKKPPFGKTTSSDDKKKRSLIPKSRLERHLEFFYQNHELTPLEKCKFFYYRKMKGVGLYIKDSLKYTVIKEVSDGAFQSLLSKSKRLYEAKS